MTRESRCRYRMRCTASKAAGGGAACRSPVLHLGPTLATWACPASPDAVPRTESRLLSKISEKKVVLTGTRSEQNLYFGWRCKDEWLCDGSFIGDRISGPDGHSRALMTRAVAKTSSRILGISSTSHHLPMLRCLTLGRWSIQQPLWKTLAMPSRALKRLPYHLLELARARPTNMRAPMIETRRTITTAGNGNGISPSRACDMEVEEEALETISDIRAGIWVGRLTCMWLLIRFHMTTCSIRH